MAETSGGSIDVLVEETEDVSVNQAPGSKFDYIFFSKNESLAMEFNLCLETVL